MAKIVLKESDIQRMIKDAINEGIKDKILNGASKLGSKLKKGWDNYEEWCTDGLEAENPSQVDFKEFGKETLKDMGSKVKKGWNKYKNWVEKDMDAPNPAYLGDPKDLEECGVKESLHRMIKESVRQVLREAYSDAQFAHLAGQAYGATNTLGGKLKGFFNPKWKKRKQRQMNNFAQQATSTPNSYSRTKGSENNGGTNVAHELGYGNGQGPVYNFVDNKFNAKNKEKPFEIQRNVYQKNSDNSYTNFKSNGEVVSNQDVRNKSNEFFNDKLYDKSDQWQNVADANTMLNHAFNDGVNAVKRKGKKQKTSNGQTTYQTGTKGHSFNKWR